MTSKHKTHSVGYHNMGHPDQGTKMTSKHKTHLSNQTKDLTSELCHHLCLDAQILSRFQKAQYALGSWPNTEVRLVRGLPGRGAISASPEASPPRPPAARLISASPEDKRQPSENKQVPPSAEPSAGPRFEGKLYLGRDPLDRRGQ